MLDFSVGCGPQHNRYGDVGVLPAGCPNCPVLDTNAVELQKEKMKENQVCSLKIMRLKSYVFGHVESVHDA